MDSTRRQDFRSTQRLFSQNLLGKEGKSVVDMDLQKIKNRTNEIETFLVQKAFKKGAGHVPNQRG